MKVLSSFPFHRRENCPHTGRSYTWAMAWLPLGSIPSSLSPHLTWRTFPHHPFGWAWSTYFYPKTAVTLKTCLDWPKWRLLCFWISQETPWYVWLRSIIGNTHTHSLLLRPAVVPTLRSQVSPWSPEPLSFWAIGGVQSLTYVWLSATPWAAAHQASLSFTISWSFLKLMSI